MPIFSLCLSDIYWCLCRNSGGVSEGVSERRGLPEPVIGTMYSSTTPREVTVVDGVRLIIASPPARDHRIGRRRGGGEERTCGARARRPPLRVHVYFRSGRHAARFTVFLAWARRVGAAASACTPSSHRALQVGARSGNRSDGRKPTGLFRENTNLEWMVLASRKRTPPVGSIFRAGLRVRVERAASTPRAATTPRRSPPPGRAPAQRRPPSRDWVLPPRVAGTVKAIQYSVFIQVLQGSTSTFRIANSEDRNGFKTEDSQSLAQVPCFLTIP